MALAFVGGCASAASRAPLADDPRRIVDELLAADRRFAAAARTDALSALSQALANDVTMPTGEGLTHGKSGVIAALREAFGSDRARADWTPIRGGISADGQHGFTFGYMTLTRPDGASTPQKYLSYWIRRPAGWRVVAYRMARRPPGPLSVTMLEPALPPRLVAPTQDRRTIARHRESLVAAERAFSDRAQEVGLGAAFEEMGSADAVNMGGRDSPSFVIGSTAIGRAVSGGETGPSPVYWGADRAIVASSGDLGVTFGIIRQKRPPADSAGQVGFPFFTIWRRTTAKDPWRYVAE